MPGAIGARQSNLSNLFNQIKKNSSITEKNTSVAINSNDDAHNLLAQKKSYSHGAASTKNHTAQSFPVAQQHYQISKPTSSSDVAQVAAAGIRSVDGKGYNKMLDSVRKSVEQFNGKCSWHFSQVSPEVGKIIRTQKKSAGGICETLAALWVERKLNGSSLQSYLQDSTGKIDPDKIRQAQQLFILGVTLNPGAMVEDKNSLGGIAEQDALRKLVRFFDSQGRLKELYTHFLTHEQKQSVAFEIKNKKTDPEIAIKQELNNLVGRLSSEQKTVLEEYLARTDRSLTVPNQDQATRQWLKAKNIDIVDLKKNKLGENISYHDFYQQMAEAVTRNISFNQSDQSYQLISIGDENHWEHRVSALIDQNKVDFFDPNFGEFHFDDKKDFVKWWPTLLQLAGYSTGKKGLPCDFYQTTLCIPQQ